MIWITGDTHGGFQRFGTKYFPKQRDMNRDDYTVVTGDFGGVWARTPEEAYWLDWLEEKPFTTLFVDGNHENFTMLNELPVHEWHGGKVHYIRPHVLHLMRGQVFEINGITFFTMGGAASHDIQDGILDPEAPGFEREYWFKRRTRQMFRVKGVSWWPEEMPSDVEYEEAVRNLEAANWKVDCILTHCAPTSILKKLDGDYTPDRLTDFLETVKQGCQFDYWFLGHYHKNCVIDERFIIQWEQMVELKLE
jgi:DNA repair exonuclease SbcCD nuclease subunit